MKVDDHPQVALAKNPDVGDPSRVGRRGPGTGGMLIASGQGSVRGA